MIKTRSCLVFAVASALAACTPATQNDEPTPVSTESSAIRCATSAWDMGDTRPVALDLSVDLASLEASLTYDRAHEYGNDDPFEFERRAWTSTVTLEAGASGLIVEDDELSITAGPGGLGEGLWTGTLASDTYGSHAVVCWEDTFAPRHSYDPSSGDCVDANGDVGFDALPVAYVRASGDGQCGTFEGLSLNEDFLGYPILRGTDLRGARLAGATLFFASILDGRFEGADLTDFEFGYAEITGTTDAHTVVWPNDSCTVEGDAMRCWR